MKEPSDSKRTMDKNSVYPTQVALSCGRSAHTQRKYLVLNSNSLIATTKREPPTTCMGSAHFPLGWQQTKAYPDAASGGSCVV